MSAPLLIPWTPSPVATFSFAVLGFTYTAPAGKYAIVKYTLSASANWTGAPTSGNFFTNPNSAAVAGELVLKAGDVMTRTVVALSTNTTATTGENVAEAHININANIAVYISAVATFSQTGAFTYTRSSRSVVHAFIQEYNVIT